VRVVPVGDVDGSVKSHSTEYEALDIPSLPGIRASRLAE